MGGAAYGQQRPAAAPAAAQRVVGELTDDVARATTRATRHAAARHDGDAGRADAGRAATSPARESAGAAGVTVAGRPRRAPAAPSTEGRRRRPAPPTGEARRPDRRHGAALQAVEHSQVVVEGYADRDDDDKYAASLERANRVREQLIRNGVDPSRVVAVGKRRAGRARRRRARRRGRRAAPARAATTATKRQAPGAARAPASRADRHVALRVDGRDDACRAAPRRWSRSSTPTPTARSSTSTTPRARAATRSSRSAPCASRTPPTRRSRAGRSPCSARAGSSARAWPSPIPARSVAFVPFALDRQIVVERKDARARRDRAHPHRAARRLLDRGAAHASKRR